MASRLTFDGLLEALSPSVKRGTLLAAIVIDSPVRGLRPSRAPREATWNLPKPVKLTSSPSF